MPAIQSTCRYKMGLSQCTLYFIGAGTRKRHFTKFQRLYTSGFKITNRNEWYLITADYNNMYYSNARSMARYGLLMQNNFKWNNTELLSDTAYINQMKNTSQPLNY